MSGQDTDRLFKALPGSVPVITAADTSEKISKVVIKARQISEWTQKNPPKKTEKPKEITKRFLKVQKVLNCRIKGVYSGSVGDLFEVILAIDKKDFLAKISQNLQLADEEVQRSVNVNGLGNILLAIKTKKDQAGAISYFSLFTGGEKKYFKYDSAADAAGSSKRIIQKIISGREVIFKNAELFVSALKDGKIAIEKK